MTRILQVFSKMGRGGSETMIMNYYRNIDRTKIQFDFLVHTDEVCAYDDEIIALGGKIYRVPFFRGYNLVSYLLKLNSFFKEHQEYKIIHIHYFTMGGLIMPIARLYNIPMRILHSHIASPLLPFQKALRLHSLRRLGNLNSTHFLACGELAGKFLFKNIDFTVMNNAIDAGKFTFNNNIRSSKRKEFNIENKFVIGHIGRFNEQKNHTFLIDIFKEIHKQDSNAVLLMVGIGELENKIKAKVTDLGLLDAVIFAGSRSDIPELMQAMDLFLFPSLWEGLGIVAIEAQAAGIPTIVSDPVPDAAMITNLAQKIKLSKGAPCWAKEILKHKTNPQPRRNTYEEIKAAGYNVEDNIKWLGNYYLDGK